MSRGLKEEMGSDGEDCEMVGIRSEESRDGSGER
jgi:hypothetical protein